MSNDYTQGMIGMINYVLSLTVLHSLLYLQSIN
jgi:hypothetical protein